MLPCPIGRAPRRGPVRRPMMGLFPGGAGGPPCIQFLLSVYPAGPAPGSTENPGSFSTCQALPRYRWWAAGESAGGCHVSGYQAALPRGQAGPRCPGFREPPQGGLLSPGADPGREQRGGLVGVRGARSWRPFGSRPPLPRVLCTEALLDAGGAIVPLSDVRAPSGGHGGSEQALPGLASATSTNMGSTEGKDSPQAAAQRPAGCSRSGRCRPNPGPLPASWPPLKLSHCRRPQGTRPGLQDKG